MIKKLLITCVSYLLILCLLKILFVPLYKFKPETASNDHLYAVVAQLAWEESRNNSNAYVANDGGSESKGLLQYKKLTFYEDWKRLVNSDIDLADAHNLWGDPANQRNLARKSLEEDWNNIRKWKNSAKKLGLL